MRVAEAVRVDLAKRFGIAVRRELVDGGDRVIAQPLRSPGGRRTARIDPQDRADQRVEALRLAGIVLVRSPAVAEPEVAAAYVKQAGAYVRSDRSYLAPVFRAVLS